MNYPIIPGFKLDLYQEFSENKVDDELYILDDDQNVLVPRYAPFFVNSLKVYDIDGNPLTKDDYRIYRMMGKLSALCAAPIACLIEITNPNIKQVVMDYHQTGSSSLFDASFIELINNAGNDQRMIKWLNIKHRPIVFDPILHAHPLTYELTTFGDVVDMVNEWASMLQRTEQNYGRVAVETQTALVRKYFERNGAFIDYALARHKTAIDAHGLTKAQIGKGLVDNIPTSTVAEVLRGTPNQRLTPNGLNKLVERYGFNGDAFLKADVLPISFYGNTSFIPPTIGGSFEGLGSLSESAAFCVESDGTISYLSNHFDGRVNGLYFSIVSGYPDNINMAYQSYRYDHPLLTTLGVVPSQVAKTDGRDLLFIGQPFTGNWFIALTNGTMDSTKHILAKVDVSAFEVARLTDQYLSAYLMGDYVVIIQTGTTGGYMGENTRRFYRIPVSDIKTKTSVVPTPWSINNPRNIDGVASTGTNVLLLADQQLNSNGKVTKAVYTFSDPYLNANSVVFSRTNLTMCIPSPSKPNIFLLKFYNQGYFNFDNGVDSQYAAYLPIDFTYEINILTGNMTWINDTGQWSLNLAGIKDGIDIISQGVAIHGQWFNNFGLNFANQNAIVMDDGNILASASGAARTPHQLAVYNLGVATPSDAISNLLSTKYYPNATEKYITESIASPLPYSLQATNVSYDGAGELFTAQGKTAGSGYQTFYRRVTGDYAIRNTVTNVNVPNIYSRPLSNDVYTTNVNPNQGRTGISGDASFLSAAGMGNLGESGFNVGVSGKLWRNTTTGWTGALADRSVRLVRSFNKTAGTNNNYIFTPTGFTTFPDALVQSLANQLIPAQYRNTTDYFVQILDMTHWANAGVTKRPVCIMIQYLDLSTYSRRCVVATLSTTYDTSKPTEYVVTDATIISSVDNLVRGQQIYATPTSWPILYSITYQASGIAELYYNSAANTINIVMNSFAHTYHTGNYANPSASFVVDGSTFTIKSGGGYNAGQEGGGTIGVIPKVGIGSKLAYTTAGANAEFMQNGSTVYCRITCYPDPAWSVFFQSATTPMFNGKTYSIPAGVVDLRTIKANPANTTFYIYASVTNGVAGYEISEAKRYDTAFNIWIGTIKTNANQILTIDRFNVLLLNGKRVSETKRGGGIPAVTGDIDKTGVMHWVYPSEIIQS